MSELGASRNVDSVRVMGAIGVIETHRPVDMKAATAVLLESGVWLRPFGKLIYTMPPYTINKSQLSEVARTMAKLAAL